jgi:crotonobetainyl-CoA:carnitine CoA-transferase CaiB-like acyl-CoA transferase
MDLSAEVEDPTLGTVVQPGIPIRFDRNPGAIRGPAPAVGGPMPARPATTSHPEPVEGPAAVEGRPVPHAPDPHAAAELRPHALAGVRIVDLGSYIAGTYGGSVLADLGADVIKVESPEGDSFRSVGADFLAFNRGKRSISLDLRTEEGREVVRRLARTADVFIENLRPASLEKLGLTYEALAAVNPRLVYASVRAFGSKGPRAAEPGFDLLGQAYTGGPLAQGGDGEPVNHSAAYADYGAAVLAAMGIQMALLERDSSGLGQRLEVSLLSASMVMQAPLLVRFEGAPPLPKGGPALKGLSPLYRAYEAADGWLFVDARGEPAARALFAALGLELHAAPVGLHACTALEPPADAVAAALKASPRDAWIAKLRAAGVIAVPIRPPRDLLDDEQFRANSLVDCRPHALFGDTCQGGALVKFSLTPEVIQRSGPLLGEHTRDVLAEAGYSAREIEDLVARGIAHVADAGRVTDPAGRAGP